MFQRGPQELSNIFVWVISILHTEYFYREKICQVSKYLHLCVDSDDVFYAIVLNDISDLSASFNFASNVWFIEGTLFMFGMNIPWVDSFQMT